MREFCGAQWRPDHVLLTRRPPRDRAPFSAFFRAPIEFNAPTAKLCFDAAVLDRRVKDHNPAHNEILRPLLDSAIVEAKNDFVSAVKSVIRAQVAAGPLTRNEISRVMGLTRHGLTRRLGAAGVTFADVADEVLLELAEGLLMKDQPISEIAAALGFADQSAFTRAFKKWAGTTPARWRAKRVG
jgi:AraC-like DNA-binding protein